MILKTRSHFSELSSEKGELSEYSFIDVRVPKFSNLPARVSALLSVSVAVSVLRVPCFLKCDNIPRAAALILRSAQKYQANLPGLKEFLALIVVVAGLESVVSLYLK